MSLVLAETFTYDANGNMVQGPDGKYYEYNDANQLIRVREGGASGEIIAEYWYRQGQRVKKVEYVNGENITTYYVGKFFETKINTDSTRENTSYYFANGERIARKNGSGDIFYYHPDHLGSTRVVTDSTGSLIESTKYYPYGVVRAGGSEKYLFTGQEHDAETGLYYYGTRYYNPELTRFTQPDSIIQDPYNPQNLNRYAYVLNNPVKYTDPSGNNPLLGGLLLGEELLTWIIVTTTSTLALIELAQYVDDLQGILESLAWVGKEIGSQFPTRDAAPGHAPSIPIETSPLILYSDKAQSNRVLQYLNGFGEVIGEVGYTVVSGESGIERIVMSGDRVFNEDEIATIYSDLVKQNPEYEGVTIDYASSKAGFGMDMYTWKTHIPNKKRKQQNDYDSTLAGDEPSIAGTGWKPPEPQKDTGSDGEGGSSSSIPPGAYIDEWGTCFGC